MKRRHGSAGIGVLLLLASVACTPAESVDSPSPPGAPTVTASPVWLPTPSTSWQWQLSGTLDLDVDADVFDVDFETTTRADTDRLTRDGRRLICYLSTGSWEEFRGDAGTFPPSVLGKVMSGWEDEQWLDIRRTDVLLPIMAARMDICAAKGFDAVEPDNVDGYLNETGFPLTPGDQLTYNRAIADLAHARGMSVALKNDVDQIPELVDTFDFAVNEECFRYEECDHYEPFVDAGKAVLHVEYQGPLDFCAESRRAGLSSMLKPLDLTAARHPC